MGSRLPMKIHPLLWARFSICGALLLAVGLSTASVTFMLPRAEAREPKPVIISIKSGPTRRGLPPFVLSVPVKGERNRFPRIMGVTIKDDLTVADISQVVVQLVIGGRSERICCNPGEHGIKPETNTLIVPAAIKKGRTVDFTPSGGAAFYTLKVIANTGEVSKVTQSPPVTALWDLDDKLFKRFGGFGGKATKGGPPGTNYGSGGDDWAVFETYEWLVEEAGKSGASKTVIAALGDVSGEHGIKLSDDHHPFGKDFDILLKPAKILLRANRRDNIDAALENYKAIIRMVVAALEDDNRAPLVKWVERQQRNLHKLLADPAVESVVYATGHPLPWKSNDPKLPGTKGWTLKRGCSRKCSARER